MKIFPVLVSKIDDLNSNSSSGLSSDTNKGANYEVNGKVNRVRVNLESGATLLVQKLYFHTNYTGS